MLIAHLNPHSQFPISLQDADYEFTTSDDGDESGRIAFPPVVARSAAVAHIGEELRVYCPRLSKTVWRGQIERIEETEDGSIVWNAIGFGALQRDALVSIVGNVSDMRRWKPVGQGFLLGSGFDSRPDLWEFGYKTTSSDVEIEIKTKRAFTISNTTLMFAAYLFEQPERYTSGALQNTIYVFVVPAGLATGIRVAPVVSIPQPPNYILSVGTFTNVSSVATVFTNTTIYGWVIGVIASGIETTPGNTVVYFRATVNNTPLDSATLALALTGQGGCCNIRIPSLSYHYIEKKDANLRDIIESIDPQTSNARYHRKRFLRDQLLPTIDFTADSPFTWRFPPQKKITDISKAPNRVYAQYRGFWTEHLTGQATVLPLESRRQYLSWRIASVGEYLNKTIAETRRDEAVSELSVQIAPLSVELNNAFYELMTRNGVCVPNWAADVGDYAEIDNYFRRGKIIARTIARDRTTYDVTFQTDDFVSAIR